MSRYKVSKLQVKRLLDGNFVVDGHGRKLYANDELKEILRMIDEKDLYSKFDIIIENGGLDIVEK